MLVEVIEQHFDMLKSRTTAFEVKSPQALFQNVFTKRRLYASPMARSEKSSTLTNYRIPRGGASAASLVHRRDEQLASHPIMPSKS